MMKNKDMANFWWGFILAAIVAAYLYWLWRRNREVLPEPVIVTRKSVSVPEDEQAGMQPDSESRIQLKPRQEVMPEVSQPDPLDTIDGIGPTYKRRLNESGIYTFAQLADASPKLLREITGVTRWDPADWISEAQQMVDKN
ncbi:MAG: helix-hairpin-helix domain-containing protein [Chloroflexota bacterium]|jgi:predicted flap endonuclease-1-like 5' DNA nuclease